MKILRHIFPFLVAVVLCLLTVLWVSRNASGDTDWQDQLTVALGGQPNPQSHAILTSWATHAEGTIAANNYLATTKKMPGSTRLPGNPSGVQEYPDQATGVEAMRWTLAQYPSFAAAIAKGSIVDLVGQPDWKFRRYCGPHCNVTAYKQRLQQGYEKVLQASGATPVEKPAEVQNNAAPNTNEASITQSEPTGMRMRFPLAISLGMIGGTVILKRRRLQVYGLLSAVAVMLAADALSERFDFEKVVAYYAEILRLFLTAFTGIIVRASLGALVLIGLIAWVSSRQGQLNALKQQMKGLWIYLVFGLMLFWDARLLIGLFAAFVGLANYGAQLGAGKMAGILTATIVGAVTLPHIPSFAKGT